MSLNRYTSAATHALYISAAEVANLEVPGEELVAEGLPIRIHTWRNF
jgi:hypothetical protein